MRPFRMSRKSSVIVFPVFFSRSVILPESSSARITSTSGFIAAIIFAAAKTGFLPDSAALRATNRPKSAMTTKTTAINPPQPASTQTNTLDFLGAGTAA